MIIQGLFFRGTGTSHKVQERKIFQPFNLGYPKRITQEDHINELYAYMLVFSKSIIFLKSFHA